MLMKRRAHSNPQNIHAAVGGIELVTLQLGFSNNGERGIRTLVRVTPKQHFQCCAFNHSAISPGGVTLIESQERYSSRTQVYSEQNPKNLAK